MVQSPRRIPPSIILRIAWASAWESLSDAEVGCLCRALMAHAAGEDVDVNALPGRFVPGLYMAYVVEIDADRAAYAATCERRAEAGRRGGRNKAKARADYFASVPISDAVSESIQIDSCTPEDCN